MKPVVLVVYACKQCYTAIWKVYRQTDMCLVQYKCTAFIGIHSNRQLVLYCRILEGTIVGTIEGTRGYYRGY